MVRRHVQPMASDELPTRDRNVLLDLRQVRLLSGGQLDRLYFFGLAPSARSSARRRTMGRLVAAGLVTTLARRIGGDRAGSTGLVYCLDADGHRMLHEATEVNGNRRIRRPWGIGWPFVQHTLDVAELFVRLREAERLGSIEHLAFSAEPGCWYDSLAGRLKPDAFTSWLAGDWEQQRWLEVDRATESLPTLTRKLLTYVEAARMGDQGPAGVLPLVLVTVPDERRLAAVRRLIRELPEPGPLLVTTELFAGLFVMPSAERPPP